MPRFELNCHRNSNRWAHANSDLRLLLDHYGVHVRRDSE